MCFMLLYTYQSMTFGGNLPPKIMPENKNAVIIVINYYCKNRCSQRESNPQLALRSSSPHRKHISLSVNLSQGKS